MSNVTLTTPPEPVSIHPAIAIEKVTKLFSRGETRITSLKEGVIGSLARKNRRGVVTALDEVSLSVARGEVIGVIGPNGSGKSTLLKLIAGISEPTSGSVTTQGRVLGLIELGAGFHPDLTGEENIRLQGSIYGLTATQTGERIESILAFAELADFRHMAVRHYSSGMFVRLGFAIAIHCDPDVLLVDEALAVGDQSFQERCMTEIERRRRQGLTIVLVTHYIEQAERICDRIAWLEQGRLRMFAPANDVIVAYYQDLLDTRYRTTQGPFDASVTDVGVPGRYGSGKAHVERLSLVDETGRMRTHLRRGATLTLEVDYTADPDVEAVDCSVSLMTSDSIIVAYTRTAYQGLASHPVDGRGMFRLHFDALALLPGRYELTLGLAPPENPNNHYDVLYKLYYLTIAPEADWDTVAPVEMSPVVNVDP